MILPRLVNFITTPPAPPPPLLPYFCEGGHYVLVRKLCENKIISESMTGFFSKIVHHRFRNRFVFALFPD